MNSVYKNIRRLRKRDGISQEILAEKLNVTRQAVSNWETGRTQPDIDTLIAIAAAFNVDVTEVIYGEKQTSATPLNKTRHKRAAVIFGAVVLVFILLAILLVPHFKQLARTGYIAYPILIFNFLLRPALYVCIPPAFFNALSLAYDIRIRNSALRKAAAAAGILIIALYVVNAANAFLGIYPNSLTLSFTLALVENPALFLIPGTALFFGLNR